MAWATRPPVHDSAVATVRWRPTHPSWSRRARSASSSSIATRTLRAVRALGRVRRLEEPRSGAGFRRQTAEPDAVEREERHARLAGPDLHRCRPRQGQDAAVTERLAGTSGRVRNLAVDPRLEPGRTALDADDDVDALVADGHVAGDRDGLAVGRRGRRGDRPAACRQLDRYAVR